MHLNETGRAEKSRWWNYVLISIGTLALSLINAIGFLIVWLELRWFEILPFISLAFMPWIFMGGGVYLLWRSVRQNRSTVMLWAIMGCISGLAVAKTLAEHHPSREIMDLTPLIPAPLAINGCFFVSVVMWELLQFARKKSLQMKAGFYEWLTKAIALLSCLFIFCTIPYFFFSSWIPDIAYGWAYRYGIEKSAPFTVLNSNVDEGERFHAAQRLHELGPTTEVYSQIFPRYMQLPLNVRSEIAYAAARSTQTPNALDIVILALTDSQQGRHRADIIYILDKSASPEMTMAIALISKDDKADPASRAAALNWLSDKELLTPDIGTSVTALALNEGADEKPRLAAIHALTGLGPNTTAFEKILPKFAQQSPQVKEAFALAAARSIPTPGANKILCVSLRDKNMNRAYILGELDWSARYKWKYFSPELLSVIGEIRNDPGLGTAQSIFELFESRKKSAGGP